jgi:hypothetical protein
MNARGRPLVDQHERNFHPAASRHDSQITAGLGRGEENYSKGCRAGIAAVPDHWLPDGVGHKAEDQAK